MNWRRTANSNTSNNIKGLQTDNWS